MEVKVEKKKGSILRVLRPKMVGQKNPKLLVYTQDGKLPPKLIADCGEIAAALGSRIQASFVCTLDGDKILLGQEIYCSQ